MPADSPLLCANASLRRAARAVSQLYEEAFRGSGIRATQFTLLQVLDRKGEMRQNELDDFLAIDSTTLSRTLKPLEQRGWIASRPGEEDRRERWWSITREGRRELAGVRPRWIEAQKRLKTVLGEERWDNLLANLARVAGEARSTLSQTQATS